MFWFRREPPDTSTPLDEVTLELIVEKCEARTMAWRDMQTFIGFLAKEMLAKGKK